jgi:hypothetical protein
MHHASSDADFGSGSHGIVPSVRQEPGRDGKRRETAELSHICVDRPMDFAGAMLVHLAKRESLTAILHRFETYGIDGHRRFVWTSRAAGGAPA